MFTGLASLAALVAVFVGGVVVRAIVDTIVAACLQAKHKKLEGNGKWKRRM